MRQFVEAVSLSRLHDLLKPLIRMAPEIRMNPERGLDIRELGVGPPIFLALLMMMLPPCFYPSIEILHCCDTWLVSVRALVTGPLA